ncbi:hypothetical protein B0H11DRAFT_2234985 [Mycena galericulata]|nr:hypothetical protein B0H11DRAFT_2234985 [Mycena galericulata]
MTDSEPRLNFIVVGASVAGLASAIALKTSGHNVLVLERDPALGGGGAASTTNGCSRIPPNGCKILHDWGLEAQTKIHGSVMNGFSFHKYYGGEIPGQIIGLNEFDPEMLAEARGGYMQFRHQTLIRILYDAATKPPDQDSPPLVSVIFGAEVVSIDCDACSVTLASGETHTGDAIIGADGSSGVVRRTLMEEEGADPDSDTPVGLAMYNAIVPRTLALEHDLPLSYGGDLNATVWMGAGRGAMTCLVGEANDITLWLYSSDNPQDGTWSEEAEIKITDVLGPSHEYIQNLAALAGPATCVQIKEPYQLESWVSESGRVLALGEAAHPFPPGAYHSYSVALEDGIFIGKIFSHTRNRDRVPEFLEERCARIRGIEKDYIFNLITLPDGEMQEGRDAVMKANTAAGRNAMDGDLAQMLDDFQFIFGYDATDDADEWWINWGRFRDSPSGGNRIQGGNIFSMAQETTFTSFTTSNDEEREEYEEVVEDQDVDDEYLVSKFNKQVTLEV